MYKNNEKIEELKAEFLKLQEDQDFEFALDIDGFIDFLIDGFIDSLVEKIINLEEGN